jgi:rubrerythrin
MNYDSTKDTEEHIKQVQGFLSDVIGNLAARSLIHDASKLVEPEKSMYDEFTPKLRGSTYGSDEYKGFLEDMGAALKHHYENNSHHPEHYEMWQCPLCESVFSSQDAPIGITDVRLCPKCSSHGAIYESALMPASGIYGMTLMDLVEMLADWKAAGMRHADGSIAQSLEINRKRFGMSDQLFEIFRNTVKNLDW